jgi:hypothetical protein
MAGQSSRCGNVGASVPLVLDSGILVLVEKLRKQGPGTHGGDAGRLHLAKSPLFAV